MKLSLLLLILITVNCHAFRLSRLTDSEGNDVAPKTYARWKSSKVSLGLGIDPESDSTQGSTTCSNISNQIDVIKKIIETFNSISDSDLEIVWGGTSGNSDINIYSFSQSEWDTNRATGGADSESIWYQVGTNVLGFASTSALCNSSICHIISGPVRVNCGMLAQIEDDSSKCDFQSVLLHELIHSLGLDHTSTQTGVMYNAVVSGSALKRTLTKDDEGGLIFLYPKTDGPTFLKYLVCGQIVTDKNSGSRIVQILILGLGSILFILFFKRRAVKSCARLL